MIVIVSSCKKNDEDPKPIVTGPNPNVPVPYKSSLYTDTTTSNDIAASRQNGTIQDWQYNQQFNLVIVERDGTDSVFVGVTVGGGQNFEWDTLKFVGDSIVFRTAIDSVPNQFGIQAGKHVIKRNVPGWGNLYQMTALQGWYDGVNGTQPYTLYLRKQPQVYTELKQWLTPADLVTFNKYFE